MNLANGETKRRLLTDLFKGNINSLQKYRQQRQWRESNIEWVIDTRATNGTIKAVNKQGNSILMSEQDVKQLDPRPAIWIIVSYSGGVTPPGIDE